MGATARPTIGSLLLPDLVIGGAPKSGTSSLFEWLAAHPEVQPSTVKEPHFLVDRGHPLLDEQWNVHDQGIAGYSRFFSPGPGLRFEASTHYLYQETAPRILGAMEGSPRVAFLLRNPAERVYSSYRYSRNNKATLRSSVSFADYVSMAADADPKRYALPGAERTFDIWSRDVEYSRYVRYLDRWLASVPRDRIGVFLFEDMSRDPRAFMMRFAQWLGLDPSFYETYPFPVKNQSYEVSSQRLQRWARRLGARLPRGGMRHALRQIYLRAQTRRSGSVDQGGDREVVNALARRYDDDNRRLAELFDLDLSVWD